MLDAHLFLGPDAAQQRGIRVFPIASRGAGHVGRGARKFFETEVGFSSPRGHATYTNPGVGGEYVLALLDQRLPGLPVSKLRAFSTPLA